MQWTEQDELAIAACRQCIAECGKRFVRPAPYFALSVRMYQELEEKGLLERKIDGPGVSEVCQGCDQHLPNGCCRKGYQFARLNLAGDQVASCSWPRAGGKTKCKA